MSKERDEKRAALGLTDRMDTISGEVWLNIYRASLYKNPWDGTFTRSWSGNFPDCNDLVDLYLNGVVNSVEACHLAMLRVKEYDRVNHLMETGPR
jgi:hypothetical protein